MQNRRSEQNSLQLANCIEPTKLPTEPQYERNQSSGRKKHYSRLTKTNFETIKPDSKSYLKKRIAKFLKIFSGRIQQKFFNIWFSKYNIVKMASEIVSSDLKSDSESEYSFKLEFSSDNSDSFEIPLKLTTKLFNYKFELLNEEINALAFDHTNIIAINILKLYQDASKDISLAFKLLNEEFTLYEFQNALEAITGRILSAPNFRRDTAHLVKKTAKTVISGCRPAYLYTKK